ncbi:MAG: hypothetical protein PHD03_04890 [Bacilli bacterium]|nr:hypothetical protein [Bacilli bacterium]MDD4734395.1 hypothetical protein [Bacilli bacterium]
MKYKYIGKPINEIRINLNDFDKKATIKEIIENLEMQDQKFNLGTNKSYSLELL